MNRILLTMGMMMLSMSAFAVDGVVLINQSTVMSAGGFPYTISQPGSYRLSGNLVIPGDTNGVQISASDVTLDLNGFNIQCSVTLPNQVSCIKILGSAHNITVRNGAISGTLLGGGFTNTANNLVGVYAASGLSMIEDLKIEFPASIYPVFGSFRTVVADSGTVLRQNILIGGAFIRCPSIFVENSVRPASGQSTFDFGGTGCAGYGNVGISALP